MKKIRLIIVTIICLVTTLVVSSFAWFAIGNNGVLSSDIETKNQLVINFASSGSNQEAMMPAKLKKGVINGPEGYIEGTIESGLKDDALLPKKENWSYVKENGQLISNSEYISTPATIVYSQFELNIGSGEENGYKDLNLSFKVRYYNVDQIKEGVNKTPIADLPLFEQMEALQFNFFIVEQAGGLTDEQLIEISTNKGTVESNKTIEEFMVKEDVIFHSIDGSSHGEELTLENVGANISNYRQAASIDEVNKTYSIRFKNIKINQTYYILLESYYNIPDALVEGNLPLTGQFVLDIHYTPLVPENPPQS